jgi:hypothetical protein
LVDKGLERPRLVETNVYAAKLEGENRRSGKEVHEVFFGFRLAKEFADI